jgi:hypothetical protein
MLLIVGALVAFSSATAVSQGISFDLTSPTNVIEIQPVDLATLVFQLSNHGERETFQLEVDLPAPLQLISPLSLVTLNSGETESIFVTVLVPQESRAGRLEVVVEATAQSDPSKRATARGAIQVLSTSTLEIKSDFVAQQEVEPGDTIVLRFSIKNDGNTTDRFVLSSATRQSFTVELDVEVLELLPGEEQEVSMRIRVPGNARAGAERVRLIGRSVTTDRQINSDIELNVLPALPGAVQSNLTLGIPSSLTISVAGDPSSPATISETLSGSGVVTSGATIGYIFRFESIALQNFRIRYENSVISTSIGDISFPLSQLITYAGRGGSFTVKADTGGSTRATIASVRNSDTHLQVGGLVRGSIAGLIPHVGMRFTPALDEILASFGTTLFFSSLGNFIFEGAISKDTTTFDSAILLQQRADIASLAVTTEFIRAGSNFLGSRADEFGIRINQIFGVQGVSVQARFDHSHNNVIEDPEITTLFQTDVGTSIRVPLTTTTSVTSQFNFSSTRDTEIPMMTDLRNFMLLGRITQQLGPLNLSVIYESNRAEDLISGSNTDRRMWQSISELGLGQLSTQFRISLIREIDLVTDTVIAEFLETRFAARIQISIAQLAIRVARTPGNTNLSAQVSVIMGNFSLISNKTLDISDTGDLEFSFTLSGRVQFQLPIPAIRVRSRVEGYVYVDENGNGTRDQGEQGVANAVVKIGEAVVRTGDAGFYRSPALEAGEFTVSLQSLPTGFTAIEEKSYSLGLKTGSIARVNIPVTQRGLIRGSVYEDLNENGIVDPGELGLQNIRVELSGADNFVEESITNMAGQFSFNVPEGDYKLKVDSETLPRLYQFTTEGELAFSVNIGEIQEFDFGAREVLEFRFAPQAEFAMTPEEPVSGQTITFNGSLSLDTDGQIVSYAWDFDGDGEVDATGDVVSHVFSEPGDYEVTLTVTDDDAQQDSESKNIFVGE